MNTLKIYLKNIGNLAELYLDFRIYKGTYQNKLIEIYVPKSILYTNEENSFVNAVKTGALLINPNGEQITTKSYYADYTKDKTINGVEYAVYEQIMPKEYTLYEGTTHIVINAVSIDNSDRENPVVLEILTSQVVDVPILNSEYITTEEDVEPTQFELLDGRVDNLEAETTDLDIRVTANTTNITSNTETIATNTNDIDYLKENMAFSETPIGTYPTQETLPTNSELTQFVVDTVNRQPRNSDVIWFVLNVVSGTDIAYKYIFTASGWVNYQIPAYETASNGTQGILQGTYAIGLTNATLVNISGGQILDIFVKDNNAIYRNIREYLNTSDTTINNIIDGNTDVGSALKSVADGVGNNIVATYLTQVAGASKDFVRQYALPRTFNDIDFITADGYQESVPTSTNPQFTVQTSSVGDFELFQIEKIINSDFEISSKNSYQNSIFIMASNSVSCAFRMKTEVFTNEWTTLCVELTDTKEFTLGTIKKIDFASSFTSLGNSVISVTNGNKIRQTLEIIREDSALVYFGVYSNETYPSTFNLNTQTFTLISQSGTIGEIPYRMLRGILENGELIFNLPENVVLNNNTLNAFYLYTNETITNDTIIRFKVDTVYYKLANVYQISNGHASASVGDLEQSKLAYKTWFFTSLYVEDIGFLIETANLENYAKTSNIPTELPNPQSLTITQNGETLGVYDGSVGTTINITGGSSSSGTDVKIDGVSQTEIDFDSDPQTQIDDLNSNVEANTTDIATLTSNLGNKANDNEVVKLTGNQQIEGSKSFNTGVITVELVSNIIHSTDYAFNVTENNIESSKPFFQNAEIYHGISGSVPYKPYLYAEDYGDNYIRYSDGTQICWGKCSQTGTPTITLPVAFINTDYEVTITNSSTSSTNTTMRSISAYSKTTTTFVRGQQGSDFGSGYIAIGKWK